MRERAAADGISCSEFIVRRCLDAAEPAAPEPVLPARVLWRAARTVLALEEMERLRLIKGGSEADWNAALARADRWIESEQALG